MPRTEEGEFELILGNKQLLSVFFIVVVLLGVFFTMGYIVGRNTAETTLTANSPAKPLVVEAGTVPGSPAPSPVQIPATMPSATDPAPVAAPPPKPKPQPVQVPAAPKPQTPSPKPVAATPKPTPKPPVPKPQATPPPVTPTPAPASGQPRPGEVYLQVAATRTAEGEVLLDVLKKRGFQGRLATVPGQDLVRVLVGPVQGPDALSRTRTALQSAGFKPFTRRY